MLAHPDAREVTGARRLARTHMSHAHVCAHARAEAAGRRAKVVMAYIVMAYVVMAYIITRTGEGCGPTDLSSYGLYSYGLRSYGLYNYTHGRGLRGDGRGVRVRIGLALLRAPPRGLRKRHRWPCAPDSGVCHTSRNHERHSRLVVTMRVVAY